MWIYFLWYAALKSKFLRCWARFITLTRLGVKTLKWSVDGRGNLTDRYIRGDIEYCSQQWHSSVKVSLSWTKMISTKGEWAKLEQYILCCQFLFVFIHLQYYCIGAHALVMVVSNFNVYGTKLLCTYSAMMRGVHDSRLNGLWAEMLLGKLQHDNYIIK